jgi:hypothetical protein
LLFEFRREWYSEKYSLIELADYEYRTDKVISFTTLFISDILPDSTPEYLPLRERWRVDFLIESYFTVDPVDKFLIYLHRIQYMISL